MSLLESLSVRLCVTYLTANTACAGVAGCDCQLFNTDSFQAAGPPRDPGRQIWGSSIIPFLSGETSLARLAIASFYAALAWTVGWHSIETRVAVLGLLLTLHVLLPYIHRHFYVAALTCCRQEADKQDLAVDQAFSILDPKEQAKYMDCALPRGCSSNAVALFLYATMFCLRTIWVLYDERGTNPSTGVAILLLAGAAFFPLHEYARQPGRHRLRHWLEFVVAVMGFATLWLPVVLGWLLGDGKCGTPAAVLDSGKLTLATYILVVAAIDMLVQTSVSEWPLPLAVGKSLLASGVVLLMSSVLDFCHGRENMFFIQLFAQSLFARITITAVFMAYLTEHEKRKMLWFLNIRSSQAMKARGRSRMLLAVKLKGVTPAQLQPDLRERVAAAMQVWFGAHAIASSHQRCPFVLSYTRVYGGDSDSTWSPSGPPMCLLPYHIPPPYSSPSPCLPHHSL